MKWNLLAATIGLMLNSNIQSAIGQDEGVTVKNGKVGIGTQSPNADLDIFNGSNAYMRLSTSTSNYSEVRQINSQFRINNNSATESLVDINPRANDGSSNQAFRLFRESNSTGPSYMDMFIGDGTTNINNRLASSGTNSYLNAYYTTLNLGIGTNSPSAQLHVKSGQPTSEHTIIAQSDNPSNSYTSTYAGVYIRNGDETNDNYARLNFGDISNTAGSVGVQIRNHTNDYGDLVFWTRGSGGFLEKMRIDQLGNIGINTTSFGSSAANVIGIGNGTAPTTSPADMIQLFSADNAGSSELKVRDEAGNITTLSPHNFSLIGKPSNEMAWSYYSEKDGKAINVDMFRVVQLLEEMTGEKLIYVLDIVKKDALISNCKE